jgi:wyosine [tRNA(Phe)-imidazoG37] synthetase (radical SAM superfamily)
MIPFGPVPSRRLGRSLGINNIPPKTCSYSCIYCQLGKTRGTIVQRIKLYEPSHIAEEVKTRVQALRDQKERIDYLTFVPDGEPTLDINLGEEIDRLRDLGIPIAVITNSSLVGESAVRNELVRADLVSLKIDAVEEHTWRKINRPHPALSLERILSGIQQFSKSYTGTLLTETMLISGINDREEQIAPVAAFLASLHPKRAYLSIPVRPPAEPRVMPPSGDRVVMAFDLLRKAGVDVECLIGEEDTYFSRTGEVAEELLGITAVHPMREDAVWEFLQNADAGMEIVQQLIEEGKLIKISYQGFHYYLRKFPVKPEGRSDAIPRVR